MTGRQCQLLRARYNLSLRQLARALRMDYRTIHRWERGEYALPQKNILRLTLVFYTAARTQARAWDAIMADA